jgi:hypothetical protein
MPQIDVRFNGNRGGRSEEPGYEENGGQCSFRRAFEFRGNPTHIKRLFTI